MEFQELGAEILIKKLGIAGFTGRPRSSLGVLKYDSRAKGVVKFFHENREPKPGQIVV